MRTVYLLSVWLHVVAAMAYVGGIVFLVVVGMPALRRRASVAACVAAATAAVALAASVVLIRGGPGQGPIPAGAARASAADAPRVSGAGRTSGPAGPGGVVTHHLTSGFTGATFDLRGEVGTAGRLGVDYALGAYLAGGGQIGHGYGDHFGWAGGFAAPLPSTIDRPGALEATDHNWVQGTTAPIVVDLGEGADARQAIVFNSIDHLATSTTFGDPAIDLWNAMAEGIEFTVYGSGDRVDALAAAETNGVFGNRATEAGTVPASGPGSTFVAGTLAYVFNDGWRDFGAAQEGDDYASVWVFEKPVRYVAVYSNDTDPFIGDGFQSEDNELDAIGRFFAPVVPTPTPTSSPSPTPTATSSATPTPRPTATASATPWHAYLPDTALHRCTVGAPADVVVVLDASTSMLRTTPGGRSKMEASLDAARQFVGHIALGAAGSHVGIVGFNDTAWLEAPMTTERPALEAALDRMAARTDQGTRLDLAVAVGAAELAGPRRRSGSRGVLVLLTDGLPNRVPTPVPAGRQEDTVLLEAVRAKAAGITVYTIGIGSPDAEDLLDRIDRDLLRAMASAPEGYFESPDAEDLEPIYAAIATKIVCPSDEGVPAPAP